MGLEPIEIPNIVTFILIIMAILVIYIFSQINSYVTSQTLVTMAVQVYIVATLIFALFINITAPAVAWDFFGEFNYEGIAHVALRSIGIEDSSGEILLRNATDRHPPYVMAFLGGVAVATQKYFGGYGYFIHWIGVYLISAAVIALTIASSRNAIDKTGLVLVAIFLTVPLLNMHGIYGSYLEIWTMCGVLLVQYFVFSLMLRPSKSGFRLFCLLMVSIATCLTRSTGYIFLLAVSTALMLTFGTIWLENFVKDKAIQRMSAVIFCAIAIIIIASALWYFAPLGKMTLAVPVAGKVLNFSFRDVSDVLVNEAHILFVLSSFSVVPLMWLMLYVGVWGHFFWAGARKGRMIIGFNTWSVLVTGVLLVLFQFTDYGAAISGVESDTGMSRLHIVFVGMQLFSIASFWAVANPNQLFLSRPRVA